MEQLRLLINKLTSYRLAFDSNEYVLVIFANVTAAGQHHHGNHFREPLWALHQKYHYNHQHDTATLNNVIKQLTVADSLQDLAEASVPELAAVVNDSITMLMDLVTVRTK